MDEVTVAGLGGAVSAGVSLVGKVRLPISALVKPDRGHSPTQELWHEQVGPDPSGVVVCLDVERVLRGADVKWEPLISHVLECTEVTGAKLGRVWQRVEERAFGLPVGGPSELPLQLADWSLEPDIRSVYHKLIGNVGRDECTNTTNCVLEREHHFDDSAAS